MPPLILADGDENRNSTKNFFNSHFAENKSPPPSPPLGLVNKTACFRGGGPSAAASAAFRTATEPPPAPPIRYTHPSFFDVVAPSVYRVHLAEAPLHAVLGGCGKCCTVAWGVWWLRGFASLVIFRSATVFFFWMVTPEGWVRGLWKSLAPICTTNSSCDMTSQRQVLIIDNGA